MLLIQIFVGIICNWFFGTAVSSEVNRLQVTIEQMRENVLTMAHESDQMYSVVNQTNIFVRKNCAHIKQSKISITNISQDLESLAKTLRSLRSKWCIYKAQVDDGAGNISLQMSCRSVSLPMNAVGEEDADQWSDARIVPERRAWYVNGHSVMPLWWYYKYATVELIVDGDTLGQWLLGQWL